MPAYKDEKRGTWYCKFTYKDWQGKKKQKLKRGFKLQRDAKEFERDFLAQRAAAPDITMGALCKDYLEYLKPRVRATTYEQKQIFIRVSVLPYWENVPINVITPKDIQQWQSETLDTYQRKQDKEKKQYSQSTKKYKCVALSSIFNYAIKFHGLTQNPARIAGSIGELKRDKMSIWTIDQFYQFIEALKNKARQDHPKEFYIMIFVLLFFSGMRIRELLALTIGDYDTDAHTISITKTLTPKGDVHPPKNSKSRVIALPSKVCKQLDEHIKKLYDTSNNALLFPDILYYSIVLTLKNYAAKAGLPEIRIHDLRHSHASMLINDNVQPLVISERLGHENIQITLDTYSHLYKSTTDSIAVLLDKKIK